MPLGDCDDWLSSVMVWVGARRCPAWTAGDVDLGPAASSIEP